MHATNITLNKYNSKKKYFQSLQMISIILITRAKENNMFTTDFDNHVNNLIIYHGNEYFIFDQ
jgi:hypothetical protein